MSDARLLMPSIRARLGAHRPALVGEGESWRAAVALVFCAPPDAVPELLFIERARREGDPWSGHMAFPGGRRDPADADVAETAARETREEVGLALGRPLAQLDDQSGNPRTSNLGPLVISPFVYEVKQRPLLAPNGEVQSTVWIPVPWLVHPDAAAEVRFERDSVQLAFPGVRYDRYTVWGLTYRILVNLFGVLGVELRPAA